jgi:hypothetical protein
MMKAFGSKDALVDAIVALACPGLLFYFLTNFNNG